eukprot:1054629-Rhodomonas_salina.1
MPRQFGTGAEAGGKQCEEARRLRNVATAGAAKRRSAVVKRRSADAKRRSADAKRRGWLTRRGAAVGSEE